ncbi:MAG: PAS domain-containing protein, partial [Deltaproteobacteria bacterium]|nr:PAS domain-containing protein [Deltaproteobacteria bacterium]
MSGSIEALREALIELQRARDSEDTQRRVLESVLDGICLASSETEPNGQLVASFEIIGRMVEFEHAMVQVLAPGVRHVLASSAGPPVFQPNDDRLERGPIRFARIFSDRPVGVCRGPRSMVVLPLPTSGFHSALVLGHEQPRRFAREDLPALRRYAPVLALAVERAVRTRGPRPVVGADSDEPVLRIASDGRLLLANRASASLLDVWGIRPGDPAPACIRDHIPTDGGGTPLPSIQIGDREFALVAAPARGYTDVFAFDVTRQHVLERELRTSERRSRRLLHTSTHAFMILDAEGRLLDSNPAAHNLLGLDEGGPSALDAVTLETLQQVARETVELGSCHRHLPLQRQAGGSFVAEFSASSNHAHDGVEVLVLVRDASAQRRADAHLETLSLVAEKTDTSVLITNGRGQIEWVNHAFTTMTGFSLGEVVGRSHITLLEREGTEPATLEEIRRGL